MLAKRMIVLAMVACVLSSVMWGCGSGVTRPEMGKVQGKVTYKGKPVSKGTVTFFPVESKGEGLPAIGELESDGAFELTTFDTGDGAILGQHKSIITARAEGARTVYDGSIPSQLPADIKKRAGSKPPVPSKYRDPEATPLRYTVRSGANNFDIELKD